jgi:hypothetical protein
VVDTIEVSQYAPTMQVVCSFCHTRFEGGPAQGQGSGDEDGETGHAHLRCPKCAAEAGIEPIKADTPKPMQLFGALLAAAGFVIVVVSGIVALGV